MYGCHVQMICDGARLYADKVHSILERNCYYDPDLGQFDVTERVSVAPSVDLSFSLCSL